MTDAELLSAIHSGKLVVVPREPTHEMLSASPLVRCGPDETGKWTVTDEPARIVWAAMVAAAPGVALEATRQSLSDATSANKFPPHTQGRGR